MHQMHQGKALQYCKAFPYENGINTDLQIGYNPSMKLTSSQVNKVAQLANLPLTSEEEQKYSEQLSKILDYIDQLNQAETENVEPIFNVTGLVNVMRKDEVEPSLPQSEATKNASNNRQGFFVTKGVFEND
ncbi:MAG: Asp-tRNA(Asn)/Glu-tRNA(Gln) amidotransferase subunit GatC [Candidatus Daviesbacteria bacterium]